MGRLLVGLVMLGLLLGVTSPQPSASGRTAAGQAAVKRDECGRKPAPKPNGKAWQCRLAEDFGVRRLDPDVWTVFHDKSRRSRVVACRRPSNVTVRGGALRLKVRKARDHGCSYTSGSISTHRRFSQRYGRFEARVKVTATRERGLQEAFWLWPDDRVESKVRWPAAGEIDVAETYSQHPDVAVPFLHYTKNDNGGPRPGLNTAWDCRAKRGRWHVYTLLWSPRRIEILIDRKSCLVNTSGDRAFRKPYIIAFTAALGVRENRVRPTTRLPATMSVDYLRVWR
jgi:beta-glucanase (GH16 family)